MDIEDDISATELRLSLLLLEKELTTVKDENKKLKNTIEQLCMAESANASKKKKSSDKWRYYHEHKHAVRAELGAEAAADWRAVKRETDARFLASSSSQTA